MEAPMSLVSRRGVILIAALFGVSGCIGSSFDDEVAKDPYISLIKQDPMFKWTPPGNFTRRVAYRPLRGQPLASQSSVVSVGFTVPDQATIPSLVALAKDASLSNGYSDRGKRTSGGIIILLEIQGSSYDQGFSLIFTAPAD